MPLPGNGNNIEAVALAQIEAIGRLPHQGRFRGDHRFGQLHLTFIQFLFTAFPCRFVLFGFGVILATEFQAGVVKERL